MAIRKETKGSKRRQKEGKDDYSTQRTKYKSIPEKRTATEKVKCNNNKKKIEKMV